MVLQKALVVMGMAACMVCAQGMSLDTVCLNEDLPMLIEQGGLLGTGSGVYVIDSARVTGGTCDSAAGLVYVRMGAFPLSLPMTVVKNGSCTLDVKVANGTVIDTSISVCATSVVRVATVSAQVRRAGGAVRVMVVGRQTETAGVRYRLDGSLVSGHPSGALIVAPRR